MENLKVCNLMDETISDIIERAKWVQSSNIGYFNIPTDKKLDEYIENVNELNEVMAKFNILFDELMMDIDQAKLEKWENEQIEIEDDYYSGGTIKNESFSE